MFQLNLIDFLVFFLTFLAISYLSSRIKTKTKINTKPVTQKSSLKTVDYGILATLRFAWKNRATLWDHVPPYERVLDLFQEHKTQLIRMRYLLNWSSAGRIVAISDLDTIKQVLLSRSWLNRFQRDHYLRIGTFGKPLGILMGNDVYWKEARKAVVTAFRETDLLNIPHIEGLYLTEIKILLEKLRREVNNEESNGHFVFSPNHMFDYPIIHVAFKFTFGRRLFESDPVEGSLMSQLNYNNSIFSLGLGAFEWFPFFKYFPYLLPTGRAYMRVSNTVNKITALELERRDQNKNCSSSRPQDIMDSLLKTMKEHAGSCPNYFNFESLKVTIRDLIFAGSDTTNVSLQHMILFMAAHQDEQDKVYAEIDSVVGHERWPTYADRNRMLYTQAMLLETLRLGSIAPVSLRINSKDCTIGDLTLKQGTYLVPVFIGCHRSEDLWEDSLKFRPERFISDDKERLVNTEKILPFSYGPRACPGELNGRIGLFMFTVILLREFKWELSDEHPAPSLLKGLRGLTRAPAPFYVKISRRNVYNLSNVLTE